MPSSGVNWRDQYLKRDTYLNDVARGDVQGVSMLPVFGELDTGGAVTNHLVWPLAGSGDLKVPDAAGVSIDITSTDAQDSAAGTGIRTVEVHYLDVNLDSQAEIVELTGLSAKTMQATDIRFIQCLHLLTAGSGKAAAGNISATNGGVTYAYIPAGKRRCSSSARMVPRNKKIFISAMAAGSSSGSAAASSVIQLVSTQIDENDLTEDEITFPHAGIALQDTSTTLAMPLPFVAYEGTVVAMEVTTDKAATVNAGWFGWMEDA